MAGVTLAFRGVVSLLMLISVAPEVRGQVAAAPGLRDGWFTTSDSVRLHYLTAGSGSVIVFVPGWTMPADIWEPQLRYFARSHRVVALDPRSQGKSEKTPEGNFVGRRAQDVQELLLHLGSGPAVLIGWSLGVIEVLQLVERFGTRQLAGLVLVDGLIWVTPNSAWSAFFDSALVRLLRDRRRFTASFVRDMYRTPQQPAYLERITQAALATPTPIAYALLADTYATGRRDWRPALSLVDRPLLYVGAPHNQETADTVRARVPGSQIEILEHAGHALFVDDAEGFNRLLDTFLQHLR